MCPSPPVVSCGINKAPDLCDPAPSLLPRPHVSALRHRSLPFILSLSLPPSLFLLPSPSSLFLVFLSILPSFPIFPSLLCTFLPYFPFLSVSPLSFPPSPFLLSSLMFHTSSLCTSTFLSVRLPLCLSHFLYLSSTFHAFTFSPFSLPLSLFYFHLFFHSSCCSSPVPSEKNRLSLMSFHSLPCITTLFSCSLSSLPSYFPSRLSCSPLLPFAPPPGLPTAAAGRRSGSRRGRQRGASSAALRRYLA